MKGTSLDPAIQWLINKYNITNKKYEKIKVIIKNKDRKRNI